MSGETWPAPGARIQAKAAMRHLPLAARKFYHPEYRITWNERDGEFAGLVCNSCNYWREFGHEDGCAVKELEQQAKAGIRTEYYLLLNDIPPDLVAAQLRAMEVLKANGKK